MARFHCVHLCAIALASLVNVGTLVSAGPTKLPPEFKLCKRDENIGPCLEEAFVGALQILSSGLPEFNIPPLEPLHVPQLEMGDSKSDAPVNLHIKFTDLKFYNIKSARTSNAKVDLDNYALSMHGYIPKIYVEADYVMDGRIVLLPAKGSGKVTINITGVDVDLNVKGVKNIKKGKEYMKVNEVTCTFPHIEKMEMHFDNLFNGDATLGKTINDLINENWNELYVQLKDPLEEGFQYTFKEYARRIFDKVPMDDVFLRQ